MKNFILEICANSVQSALNAFYGGADRIELCDNIEHGGTTPSYGTIAYCKRNLSIPIFPLIRPRNGDFVYTEAEFEVMKADVVACKQLGCEGVVFGLLTADGKVDKPRCQLLINLARPMLVTFHRAFDRCTDLKEALEGIIVLGFDRILTSGGELTAPDGAGIIHNLILQANNRIMIMPGSGINACNIANIATLTGALEFHSTAKSTISKNEGHNKSGALIDADRHEVSLETNANEVMLMRQQLNHLLG